MKSIVSDPVAYPPRGLRRAEAARYIGVGVTKFGEMVEANAMPPPKKVGKISVWDRIELDAAFTDLDATTESTLGDLLG